MFAHRYLIFDRVTNRLRIVANAKGGGLVPRKPSRKAVDDNPGRRGRPCGRRSRIEAPPRRRLESRHPASLSAKGVSGKRVEKCLDHIRKGTSSQAVLSSRFSFGAFGPIPSTVYRAPAGAQSSLTMFYLKMADWPPDRLPRPELMVKVEGTKVSMNPIAADPPPRPGRRRGRHHG